MGASETPMSDTDYGAIVIGAGPGGYPCAIRLGQLGVKTLIVEKEFWGGVCLNVGCIPSKAMITAAKHFEEMQHASDFGIEITGDITMNAGALQTFKNKVVDRLTGGVSTLLKGNKVEQAMGTATITGPNTVEIDGEDGKRTVTAEHIVIATGSTPIQIPGFEFAEERIIDSTGALALNEIPKRLAVIGGGYIGLELGGMFSKLGTDVTVIEMMDQILPGFDSDVTKILARKLKKQKVKTLLNTKATKEGIEQRSLRERRENLEYIDAKKDYELSKEVLNKMQENLDKESIDVGSTQTPIVMHENAVEQLLPARPNIQLEKR